MSGSKKTPDRPQEGGNASEPRRTDAIPRISVAELLGPAREAILEHNREEYRLRITASGKLILTK